MNQLRSTEECLTVTTGYTNGHGGTFSPASPGSSSYDSSSSEDASDTSQENKFSVDLEDSEADNTESRESTTNPPDSVTMTAENQLHVNRLEAPEEDNLCSGFDAAERVHSMSNSGSHYSASLETAELWKQFDDVGTEMIVTRRGRRMFPPLKVQLFDLDPNAYYVLLMDMSPCDKYRYKYQNSAWQKCFEEECSPTRLYIHPDSPALGSNWMKSTISFYKLKLTNNQLDKLGHIIVNSMHKYQPRLHIVETTDVNNLKWEDFNTIIFPRTQFMTVTAYQNDRITQLKIDNNPFAKGFRLPFSRVRQRTRFPTPHKRYIISSGSDSSIDENNVLVQIPGGTVIHTGPSFMPAIEQGNRKRHVSGDIEEANISKRICLISTSKEGAQRPLPHIVSPKLAYSATSGHPVSVSVSSVPESSSTSPPACHSPSVLEGQEIEVADERKNKYNKHESINGECEIYFNHKKANKLSQNYTFNGRVSQDNVRTSMIQTSGHGVHLPGPIILQQPHPVMSSPQCSSPVKLIPVNGLNGINGTTTVLQQPHALANGQAFLPKSPPVALVNGMNYTMVVQANGQPASFLTIPSTASSAVYTSAPTQLVNTELSSRSSVRKTISSIPIETESKTIITNHTPKVKPKVVSVPPPLVPVNTLNHSVATTPQNLSFVLQSSPPETPPEKVYTNEAVYRKSQNGVVYIQAPPTSYQKLVILPVMMNSGQDSSNTNTVLIPVSSNDTTGSSPLPTVVNNNVASSLIPDGYEEQMPSSMPIYRFNALNGMQPVHFIPTKLPKNMETT